MAARIKEESINAPIIGAFEQTWRWMRLIESKLRINYKRATKEYSRFAFARGVTRSPRGEPLTTIDPSMSNVDFKAVVRDRHCDVALPSRRTANNTSHRLHFAASISSIRLHYVDERSTKTDHQTLKQILNVLQQSREAPSHRPSIPWNPADIRPAGTTREKQELQGNSHQVSRKRVTGESLLRKRRGLVERRRAICKISRGTQKGERRARGAREPFICKPL